jgi:hypothetical protein
MFIVDFWVVMPCGLVGGYQCSDVGILYKTTWRQNPEDHSWHLHHYENAKSHINPLCLDQLAFLTSY